MKKHRPATFLVALFLVAAASLTAQTDGTRLVYPKAKMAIRWTTITGEGCRSLPLAGRHRLGRHARWVEAENKLTFSYLDQIPYRGAIRDRLTKLWNYERFTVPQQRGGRYFYEHNNGLQNQNVLLVAESLNAEPRVLLDPNTLSSDGTVALAGHADHRTTAN